MGALPEGAHMKKPRVTVCVPTLGRAMKRAMGVARRVAETLRL